MHAVRTATDITFICPDCKIGDPSPHVSFDVADVSFDHTGCIPAETLQVSDDDQMDSDVPDDISDTWQRQTGRQRRILLHCQMEVCNLLHICLSVCLNGYIPAVSKEYLRLREIMFVMLESAFVSYFV